MSHVFELSDEQYEVLRRAAEARGETAETLLTALVEELCDPYTQPRYYETDEWLRHLGATDEQIREAERLAELDDENASDNRLWVGAHAGRSPHHLAARRRP